MSAASGSLGIETCRALLRSPDLEVLDLPAYFADLETRGGLPLPNVRAQIDRLLFFVSGDRHLALRRAVLSFFRPGVVAAWRPVIAACADRIVDGLPPEADLVAEFAAPVSSEAICRVLGLPVARRAEFDVWVEEMRWLTEPMLPMRRLRVIEARLAEFAEAVAEAMRAPPAEAEGRPTFLHAPIPGLADEDRLWLAIVLYGAGQSTLHTVANILLALTDLPVDDRAVLLDPDQRMAAVDRLTALGGSIQYVSRLAGSDIRISGQDLTKGDRIDLPLAVANRDMLGGACPLDQAQGADAPHLAFGAGLHKCIGALLARVVMAEALTSLVRRYPRFALARPPRGFQSSVVIVSPLDLLCSLN